MITYLRIKNFITISECNIDFNSKFNVITGESGAGKSIIFNAINQLLGKPSNQSFIKNGEDFFEIEGIFNFSHTEILSKLSDYNDEDNPQQYCIYRKVDKQKNIFRINNIPVTSKVLKELAPFFAVIVSQHHQLMLEKHQYLLTIIDSFFDSDTKTCLDSYHTEYKAYAKLKQDFNTFQNNTQLDQQLDFLDFQINDISQHHFVENEDTELEDKKKALKDHKKHVASFNAIQDQCVAAKNNLQRLNSDLSAVSDLPIFSTYLDQLSPIEDILSELDRDVGLQLNSFDSLNSIDIDQLEARLDTMFKIKLKYKVNSINDLLELKHNLVNKKEQLLSYSTQQESYIQELNKLKESLCSKAKILHDCRVSIASKLEHDIVYEAKQLCLGDINLVLQCHYDETEIDSSGATRIQCLISLNKGMPLKELSKVASGGELSRILLAIYAVISYQAPQSLFLFDEIDTGVGGLTANYIGQKLHQLSESKQLICITHLAQIAQHSHQHILVTKQQSSSSFSILDDKHQTIELHRMIGGDIITEKLLIN